MKDNIKKAFNIVLFSLVVIIVITFFSIGGNFIIWTMLVAGVVATGIFAYFYKKSKPVYILFYTIALISIYLIGAYLYTSPFLALKIVNCVSCGPSGYLFMTNHFHIIDIGNIFALYNETYYVPYNISLYEPTYSMFPFQTKVPNLLNQTITLKLEGGLNSETFTIEAKYKIINESIISNWSKYTANKFNTNYYSSPVYLLVLRPETTNTQIINYTNLTATLPTLQLLNYTKNLTGYVASAEYNGITIT